MGNEEKLTMMGSVQNWIDEVRERFATFNDRDSGKHTALALMDELADLVSTQAMADCDTRASTPSPPEEAASEFWRGYELAKRHAKQAMTFAMLDNKITGDIAEDLMNMVASCQPDPDTSPAVTPSPSVNDTAAEVLGRLVIHLLQEHWPEAKEMAAEIKLDWSATGKPVAIDFATTPSTSVQLLLLRSNGEIALWELDGLRRVHYGRRLIRCLN